MKRILTLLILFFSSVLFGARGFDVVIDLMGSVDHNVVLDKVLPKALYVREIDVRSDICFDTQEVLDILGLAKGTSVTRKRIKQGVADLKNKKKIQTVRLIGHPEKKGWRLGLSLQCGWAVHKIVFKGTMPSKDRYRRYYFLEPGELFQEKRHQEALKQLRDALYDDGYMRVCVTDKLVRKEAQKEIDITITVDAGKRFFIDKVAVRIDARHDVEHSEKEAMERACVAVVESSLDYSAYSKPLVEEQQQAIRQYCYEHGFADVVVTYEVVQHKQKNSVQILFAVKLAQPQTYLFTGNSYFDREQLLAAARVFGPSVYVVPPAVIAGEVEELYRDAGFLDVTVSWTEEPGAHRFSIHEGTRYRIAKVQLVGVGDRAQELAHEYFSAISDHAYYDAGLVQRACDQLTQWYMRQGYWDWAIQERIFIETADAEEKVLELRVSEGTRRFLAKIIVEPFSEVMYQGPFAKYAKLKRPIPFDMYLINEQQEWLARYLHDKGFLYSTYKPNFQEGPTGMTLIWKIEGPSEPVCFGRTIVVGNATTPSWVLLRGLDYREGDVWNRKALDRSLERLKSLGLFESLSLQPADIFKPEPLKAMILKVCEDDPFEVRMRAGFGFVSKNLSPQGSGLTYRAGGSFVWRNPARHGDILRMDADVTRYVRGGYMTYAMPWWDKFPMMAIFKLYGSHCDQPFVVGASDTLYKLLRIGSTMRLQGKQESYEWGVNTGLEWMRIDGLSLQRARELDFSPFLVDRGVPYVLCEPMFVWDRLDDRINPKHGWLTSLSARGMFPLTIRDAWLIRLLAEQSYFVTYHDWLTLAMRLRLGTILNVDFQRIMPPERFYLGGADSLRGYEQDLAPPLNTFVDAAGIRRWVPIGGKSMVDLNVELRFPIYGNFDGVLFTDIGALSQEKVTDIMSHGLLGASGCGLRYNTPIGALRFDIGWKWKKRFPEDPAFAWFFTVGNTF